MTDLRYTTLTDEIALDRLPIEGTIPTWLTGTLLRNGPAQFEVGTQHYKHWFDGLAMLHKFAFANGQVGYANKFLTGKSYTQAHATGKISYGEFGTDPCRTVFGRVASLFSGEFTDNAVVSIGRMADDFVAMTETPVPVVFDPQTLRTIGDVRYTDAMPGTIATAHPHYDFDRRQLINYMSRVGQKNSYTVYYYDEKTRKRCPIGALPAKELAYIHSFAMTENYVILVACPLVYNAFDLLKAVLKGVPIGAAFRWEPQEGTHFLVFSRKEQRLVATYETGAFFTFHHVNAFERSGQIVIDLMAHRDATIVAALYLDNLRRDGPVPDAILRRFTLSGGAVQAEDIGTVDTEMPRINYRAHNTQVYRFVYGTTNRNGVFFSAISKLDVTTGTHRSWYAPDCYPGEPVFVAAPDATGEDNGVVLSVVLDNHTGKAFLLVLDAASFTEMGRAAVPHHIPLGFHGAYFAA